MHKTVKVTVRTLVLEWDPEWVVKKIYKQKKCNWSNENKYKSANPESFYNEIIMLLNT